MNEFVAFFFSMQICGEHKESGILKHGFFASPFSQDVGPVELELEIKERHNGGNAYFAISFVSYFFQ